MKSFLYFLYALVLTVLICMLQNTARDDYAGRSIPGQNIRVHLLGEAILEESEFLRETLEERNSGTQKHLLFLTLLPGLVMILRPRVPRWSFTESFFNLFIYRSSSGRSPPCFTV